MNEKIIICTINDNGCWLWTGAKASAGYGKSKIPKTRASIDVHRLMLSAKLGRAILPKMLAMHDCDMPPCVNPNHLIEGTKKQNAKDAVSRGRIKTYSHCRRCRGEYTIYKSGKKCRRCQNVNRRKLYREGR